VLISHWLSASSVSHSSIWRLCISSLNLKVSFAFVLLASATVRSFVLHKALFKEMRNRPLSRLEVSEADTHQTEELLWSQLNSFAQP
jgi:hypothetical protein